MKNTEKEQAKKLAFVRSKLNDTAKHAEIAYKSGVSLSTINNVRRESKKVKDSTLDKLYAYFKGGWQ